MGVTFVETERRSNGRRTDNIGRSFQLAAGAGAVLAARNRVFVGRLLVNFISAVVAVIGNPLQFAHGFLLVVVQQHAHSLLAYALGVFRQIGIEQRGAIAQ